MIKDDFPLWVEIIFVILIIFAIILFILPLVLQYSPFILDWILFKDVLL